MVDLGELRRRLAVAYRFQPGDLLALELGVVRDDRRRRPAFRGSLVGRGEADGREQQFLLHGGQADQAGDSGAQRKCVGHAARSFLAMNFSTPSTTMVILAKPRV